MFNVIFILTKPYLSIIVYSTSPTKQSNFDKNKEAPNHKKFKESDTKAWIPVTSHVTLSRNT